MSAHHYFFALTLPDEMKHQLKELSAKIKKEFPFNRWVHEADYHITFAFLGRAEQNQLNEAVKYAEDSLKDSGEFAFELGKAGTFGNKKSPRILWIGTTNEKVLAEIRDKVINACSKAGFQLETRPFKPHITLARKWAGEEEFSSQRLNEFTESLLPVETFTAKEVTLYRTHLDQTPKYEQVVSFQLKP